MDMNIYVERFEKSLVLRNFTVKTAKSYLNFFKCYLLFLGDADPEVLCYDTFCDFILYLKAVKKLSPRTINGYISVVKFFYQTTLGLPLDDKRISFLKFDSFLPTVLSVSEVELFISSISNLKHRAIVSLLYSSGLRISEVCNLKYDDISRDNMTVYIRYSKSRHDRFAILSERCLDILTLYWRSCGKPRDWLFPGQDPSKSITTNSVSSFILDTSRFLGFKDNVSAHTFRHSFATHLYEDGADLLTIQQLLGHRSLKSTSIYIHLSSKAKRGFVSPFDRRDVR